MLEIIITITIDELILFFNLILKAIDKYNSFRVRREYTAFFVNSEFNNFVELDDIDIIEYMNLDISYYENVVEIVKTY